MDDTLARIKFEKYLCRDLLTAIRAECIKHEITHG